MKTLSNAIASLAHDLHPDVALSLADELEKRPQDGILSVLRGGLAGTSKEHLAAIESALGSSAHASPRDMAFMIRGAAAAASVGNRGNVELVWTGPHSGIVPIRRTEQVLAGLIDGSQRDLFIVSFVAYDADPILKSIASATSRGVRVRILMERGEAQGGVLNFDSMAKVRSAIPAAEFYTWSGENPGFDKAGSVHAKCAVADGDVAFITSANLTGAAMERNMELGVLVRGGHLPHQLQSHLQALIMTGKVTRS